MDTVEIIITVVVLAAIVGPLLTLYYSRKINDLKSKDNPTPGWDDDDPDTDPGKDSDASSDDPYEK